MEATPSQSPKEAQAMQSTFRVHAHHAGTRVGVSQDIVAPSALVALDILRPVLASVMDTTPERLTFTAEEV